MSVKLFAGRSCVCEWSSLWSQNSWLLSVCPRFPQLENRVSVWIFGSSSSILEAFWCARPAAVCHRAGSQSEANQGSLYFGPKLQNTGLFDLSDRIILWSAGDKIKQREFLMSLVRPSYLEPTSSLCSCWLGSSSPFFAFKVEPYMHMITQSYCASISVLDTVFTWPANSSGFPLVLPFTVLFCCFSWDPFKSLPDVAQPFSECKCHTINTQHTVPNNLPPQPGNPRLLSGQLVC